MTKILIMFLALCLIATAAIAAEPVDFKIETLDGAPFSGPITRWTASQLDVETATGPVTLQTDRLLSVRPIIAGPAPLPPATSKVELTDGSTIRLTDFICSAKQATLILPAADDSTNEATNDGSSRIVLPRRSVSLVQLQELTPNLTQQWLTILAERSVGDVLVIRKNDSLDHVEGVIQSVTKEEILFKMDGDQIGVNRKKVFGFIFHRQSSPSERRSQCIVFTRNGSRYAARTAHLEDGFLAITSHAGFERSLPLADIERIDFSAGKVAYLSDLPFESVNWTPFFAFPDSAATLKLSGQPRRDEAFGSRPLNLDGTEYAKGLALRTRTEVVYRLAKQYQEFSAIAGLDKHLGSKGHVVLEILGDDRSLLKIELQGDDPSQPIKLDVTGVKRLKIIADYGENLDVADFLNLCDAKVLK